MRGELAALEQKLGEAREKVAPDVLARAKRDLDALKAEVERARGEDLALGAAAGGLAGEARRHHRPDLPALLHETPRGDLARELGARRREVLHEELGLRERRDHQRLRIGMDLVRLRRPAAPADPARSRGGTGALDAAGRQRRRRPDLRDRDRRSDEDRPARGARQIARAQPAEGEGPRAADQGGEARGGPPDPGREARRHPAPEAAEGPGPRALRRPHDRTDALAEGGPRDRGHGRLSGHAPHPDGARAQHRGLQAPPRHADDHDDHDHGNRAARDAELDHRWRRMPRRGDPARHDHARFLLPLPRRVPHACMGTLDHRRHRHGGAGDGTGRRPRRELDVAGVDGGSRRRMPGRASCCRAERRSPWRRAA